MASGVVRPLIRLARYPDTTVMRTAAVAIAGLALGKASPWGRPRPRLIWPARVFTHDFGVATGDPDPCPIKHALIEMGALPPMVDMVRTHSSPPKSR